MMYKHGVWFYIFFVCVNIYLYTHKNAGVGFAILISKWFSVCVFSVYDQNMTSFSFITLHLNEKQKSHKSRFYIKHSHIILEKTKRKKKCLKVNLPFLLPCLGWGEEEYGPVPSSAFDFLSFLYTSSGWFWRWLLAPRRRWARTCLWARTHAQPISLLSSMLTSSPAHVQLFSHHLINSFSSTHLAKCIMHWVIPRAPWILLAGLLLSLWKGFKLLLCPLDPNSSFGLFFWDQELSRTGIVSTCPAQPGIN